MKISCNQQNLSKTLSIVSRALGSRQLPILENILITADPVAKTITCVATNLEIAIKMTMAAEITSTPEAVSKQVLLPGKQLNDIVHSFSSGRVAQVEINTTESGASIKCGKSTFKLPVAPVAEFPEVKEPSGDSFTVPIQPFLTAVKQTIYATDPKDNRQFAQCILFDIEDTVATGGVKQLALVGTDTSRLVIKKLSIENGFNAQIMIPANLLRKMVDVVAGTKIKFYISNNQLFAILDNAGSSFLDSQSYISVRLMNCQYPRYQQVIPKDLAGQMIINRAEFIRVLERAELIDQKIKVEMVWDNLNGSNAALSISCIADDKTSQFQEGVEINKHSGEPQFLNGFNAKFLLDFLKSITSDTVELNYMGVEKPILMHGDGDESLRYIVMPIRLPETQNAAA